MSGDPTIHYWWFITDWWIGCKWWGRGGIEATLSDDSPKYRLKRYQPNSDQSVGESAFWRESTVKQTPHSQSFWQDKQNYQNFNFIMYFIMVFTPDGLYNIAGTRFLQTLHNIQIISQIIQQTIYKTNNWATHLRTSVISPQNERKGELCKTIQN